MARNRFRRFSSLSRELRCSPLCIGHCFFIAIDRVPDSARDGPERITTNYPVSGSVFPPDMAAPTFLWRSLDSRTVANRLIFPDGSPLIAVESISEQMRISEIDPRRISPNYELLEVTPELTAMHLLQFAAGLMAQACRTRA